MLRQGAPVAGDAHRSVLRSAVWSRRTGKGEEVAIFTMPHRSSGFPSFGGLLGAERTLSCRELPCPGAQDILRTSRRPARQVRPDQSATHGHASRGLVGLPAGCKCLYRVDARRCSACDAEQTQWADVRWHNGQVVLMGIAGHPPDAPFRVQTASQPSRVRWRVYPVLGRF